MPGAAFVHFSHADVVRNPLVTRIVRAYEAEEKARADAGDDGGRERRRR